MISMVNTDSFVKEILYRQRDGLAGRQAGRQMDRQTDRQMDRQAGRQTGRQTDRQIQTN